MRARTIPCSAVGLADLVNWIAAREREGSDGPVTDAELVSMAAVLGLVPKPPQPAKSGADEGAGEASRTERAIEGGAPPPVTAPVTPSQQIRLAPVPFLQATRIELDDRVGDETGPPPVNPFSLEEIVAAEGRVPAHPALATWATLEPALRMSMPRRGRGPIDVVTLVRRESRLEACTRLPRKPPRGWSTSILVLVDCNPRLGPFGRDQHQLWRRLKRYGGRVEKRIVRDIAECCRAGPAARALAGATAVLALSDLGVYCDQGDQRDREAWRRLGRALERRGIDRAALVPAPSDRWIGSSAREWNARVWDRGSARFAHTAPSPPSGVGQILDLLSIASRIEPGLLRAVRQCLGQRRADVGTERDVWFHEAMGARRADATVLASQYSGGRRPRFAESPHAAAVVDLLRAWHRPLQLSIWYEEVLAIAAPDQANAANLLRPGELAEAEEFYRRLGASVEGNALSESQCEAIGTWTREFESRLSPDTWADPEKRRALTLLWSNAHQHDPNATPPPGADIEVIELRRGRLRAVELVLGSDGVHIRPSVVGNAGEKKQATNDRSSRVGTIWLARPTIGLTTGSAGRETFHAIENDRTSQPLAQSLVEPLVIRTDRTRLTVASIRRPEWASSAGCDQHGLWAEFSIGGGPPVRHRLRWIAPGRFWMGSLPSETGRFEDEGPRHLVTIGEGFWLGETPCTQGLWEAVMGENPSEFRKSKDGLGDTREHPVEQVDWQMCVTFVGHLESMVGRGGTPDGLKWRLPSEAEWEYACRAGTEEATYAGGWKDEAAAAAVLDRIAWHGGNSGGSTHAVGLKGANGWGLHDMLGNVWEWCEDGMRKYRDSLVEDPRGSADLGAGRVLRGGSWVDGPRRVRAAGRFVVRSSSRVPGLGFRLARGPSGASQVK